MRITKATPKAINYACKNFHYSKSVPTVQFAYNIYAYCLMDNHVHMVIKNRKPRR